ARDCRACPPPPIPEKPRSPTPEKPRSILALISSLLSSPTSPNAWEKVKLRRTLSGHTDVVRSIAISPDGQILVSGSYDKTI
ncbi:MAG TPA: hypothetical protein DDZ80_18155, partial [Cyanobacteria bacterium UBA8803]|nr:hypothetical protein [Cyanobacteria bacterium UBA8803]